MSDTDYSFEPETNNDLINVDEIVEDDEVEIGTYDSSQEASVVGEQEGLQFDSDPADAVPRYSTFTDSTPSDIDMGVAGEVISNGEAIPEPDPLPNKIKRETVTHIERISEINEDLIQFVSDNNARIYAVLDDETRVQCELTDVFEPNKAHTQVFVNQGLILANALKQHFWYDSNGAHVTDDEQDDWNEEYAKTNHGDLANPTLNRPWHNILINSYGLLIRKGLIWLSQHSVGSVMFYDGIGNTLNNVVASFSTDGVQIGKLTEKHLIVDDDGLTAYDENGNIAPITAYLSGSLIEDSTITGSKIASSTISGSNMIDGTITGTKIASSTIENSNIKDGTITGGKIVGATLTGIPQAAIVNLSTDYAHITNGTIDNATIDHADVNGLSATYATITNLSAATGRITTLETNTADIATLRANSAKVANLTAQQLEAANAYISSLTAGNVTANDIIADTGKIHNLTAQQLSAAVGYIADLISASIDTTDLIADHGTISSLDTNYAQVNMANVNNAWITNGTVKDGAITNAMINSVSANKLTAGTIDASNITVTNLNADNITTGTINGQRIGAGSLSLDKLSDDVYTETEVDSLLATMQSEIDGAIETWTGTAVPTLNNAPASSWSTNADKDKHVGDVYFVVNSQSQQNGYNYRFTKSGNTYSWQLIKDTDITNALSRLATAEGSITQFSSDISQLQTSTGTLTTKTTQLETSLGDKVDVTDFNDLEDTVDGHTQTLSQHTTAISNKADSSTVTSVTNRVSKNEQDISGINTTISQLQTTVASKADGSTVTTISNKVNTVSDTVDGHTSQLSSITSTQTTIQSSAIKSTVQLWFTKANTTAPNKPTAHVTTNNAATGNAWNLAVPTYSASYPNYFYCYEYEFLNGTYGWSAVTRDIATGEMQERARTAITNAAAADTKAGNAATAASNAQNTANKNVKESIQLWFTKANTTAPSKPTAKVTSTATTGDAWTTKVPTYNASYPYYYYCIQYVSADGTTTWSDVVYDQATTEVQSVSRTASSNLSTLQTDYAAFKQTTQNFESTVGTTYATKAELGDIQERVSTAETTIEQNSSSIALKANSTDVYTKTQTDGLISTEVTNRNAAITAATDAINLSVSQTYATKTYVDDGLEDANDYTDTEVASAKAAIKVTTDDITTEVAKKTDKTAIISTINQTAETVKIAASKVDITGEAVFSAINNDTGTTKINGGKIDATSITLGYSQIMNPPTIPTKTSDLTNDSSYATTSQIPTKTSDLTNDSSYATTSQAQAYADAKDTAIVAASKRTYVSIRATAIDFDVNTATLEATLYVDGTATTTGVSYLWLMDGTVISGQTARNYSVPAANGLDHAYSCTCTVTV